MLNLVWFREHLQWNDHIKIKKIAFQTQTIQKHPTNYYQTQPLFLTTYKSYHFDYFRIDKALSGTHPPQFQLLEQQIKFFVPLQMNKNRKEYQKAALVRPLNLQKPILNFQTAPQCPESSNSKKSDLYHLFDSYFKVSKDPKKQRKTTSKCYKSLRTRLFEDEEIQRSKKRDNNNKKFLSELQKCKKVCSLDCRGKKGKQLPNRPKTALKLKCERASLIEIKFIINF